MSLLRTILAILIGFSLAVTPVGVAFATSAKASNAVVAAYCAKTDMGDCACCDKAVPCQFDSSCAAKCMKILGSLACVDARADVGANRYALAVEPALELRSWPPPAPPPRS